MKRFLTLTVLVLSLLAGADLYAQDYKLFLDQGVKLYNQHQYDEAIKVFNAGMADGSEAAKQELGSWITKCQNAKAAAAAAAQRALERLELSQQDFIFASVGGEAKVDVSAGSSWRLANFNCDWCEAKVSGNSINLIASANQALEPRSTEITVEMPVKQGRTTTVKRQKISIKQDARDEAFRNIVFHTSPDNASIHVSGSSLTGYSGEAFRLGEGDHEITISKNEYEPVTMTVTINPDDNDIVRYIDVELKPKFALLHLNFDSSDGSVISSSSDPYLKIGDNIVGIDGYFSGIYDSSLDSRDAKVEKFKLYKGNYIPVPAGEYCIIAQAKGYEQDVILMSFQDGDKRDLNMKLQPRLGRVKLVDKNGAEGARIIVDRKDVGVVPAIIDLPLGSHVISFIKEGCMTLESNYMVEVKEDQEYDLLVEMFKYATVDINSNQSNAAVLVDGRMFNVFTPAEAVKIPVGASTISLEKTGYFSKPVSVNLTEGDTRSLYFSMSEVHPLHISAGNENLFIILKDNDDFIFTCDSITPNTVTVPYGDYTLELRHFNKYKLTEDQLKKIERLQDMQDLAYKRNIKFAAGNTDINVNSFSNNGGYAILSGNYNLMADEKNGYKVADAGLCKVPVFKGFSTNVLRASALKYNDEFFFSGTIIFLNGELRVGGAIFDYLDVSALGTYAWTPNLAGMDAFDDIINFKHFAGIDGFVGIELCSRIPVFNANVRIGEQFLNGNFYQKSGSNLVPTKVSNNMFVVSLGFTLGTKGSKGANMIRCW